MLLWCITVMRIVSILCTGTELSTYSRYSVLYCMDIGYRPLSPSKYSACKPSTDQGQQQSPVHPNPAQPLFASSVEALHPGLGRRQKRRHATAF